MTTRHIPGAHTTQITVERLGISLRTQRFGVCSHKSLSLLLVLPIVVHDAYSSKTVVVLSRNKINKPTEGFDMT
jgi:hypothetical protein